MIKRGINMIDTVNLRHTLIESKNNTVPQLSRGFNEVYSVAINYCKYHETMDEGYANIISTYFKESVNHADFNLLNCCKLFNILEEYKTPLAETIYNGQYFSYITPNVKDISVLEEAAKIINNEKLKTHLEEVAKIYSTLDRVYDNNTKLNKRFNIMEVAHSKYRNPEALTESVCDFLDTYNVSIHKKLNIALEETLYLLYNNNAKYNINEVVQNILEYYLANTEVITDKDYRYIKEVLETNLFLDNESISNVRYFLNESNTYSNKVRKLSNNTNGKIKEVMKDIADCKTLTAAKVIIKRAFMLIESLFIVTGTVIFAEVVILLVGIFSLIMIIGCTPMDIINEVDKAIKGIDTSKYDEVKKERYKQVLTKVKELKNENKTIKEAADSFEQAIPADLCDPSVMNVTEPNPQYAFTYIRDIVTESKDFADSDDVRKLLDAYKADQNKTVPKLTNLIHKIYAKKPEQIIDDLPKILEVIRTFGILGLTLVPVIGPVLALVTFCADRYIAMGIKREEAEKVCKYFNSEKNKVEKKLNNMADGQKKDNLEEYLACLNKAIYKLETYRDNLYSENGERLSDLFEESATANMNRLSVAEYFEMHFSHTCAIYNLVYTNIIALNRLSNSIVMYNKDRCFNINSAHELMMNFITPDGFVEIPILFGNRDEVYTLYDRASYVLNKNGYANKKVYVIDIVDNSILVFRDLEPLYITSDFDYAFTESGKSILSNLLEAENVVDTFEAMNMENIISEMCNNIEKIITESDLDILAGIINYTQIDSTEFINTLKDAETWYHEPSISSNIKNCIDCLESTIEDNNLIYQTEAVIALRYIVEEVKNKADKSKNENIITKAKKSLSDKVGNAGNKTKDGKLSITTNLALTGEVLKHKAQDLSTKEKELSTTIDANLSGLKKAIERSLTNDRREAIIKGSVIPSFSKIIKSALTLGGIAVVFNPAIAAITAVGALATSKVLNEKERKLLLDEIDIELKVVEKELENADRDQNTKKYRQLLMYQRKLQREAQRIRYRLKVYAKDQHALVDPKLN